MALPAILLGAAARIAAKKAAKALAKKGGKKLAKKLGKRAAGTQAAKKGLKKLKGKKKKGKGKQTRKTSFRFVRAQSTGKGETFFMRKVAERSEELMKQIRAQTMKGANVDTGAMKRGVKWEDQVGKSSKLRYQGKLESIKTFPPTRNAPVGKVNYSGFVEERFPNVRGGFFNAAWKAGEAKLAPMTVAVNYEVKTTYNKIVTIKKGAKKTKKKTKHTETKSSRVVEKIPKYVKLDYKLQDSKVYVSISVVIPKKGSKIPRAGVRKKFKTTKSEVRANFQGSRGDIAKMLRRARINANKQKAGGVNARGIVGGVADQVGGAIQTDTAKKVRAGVRKAGRTLDKYTKLPKVPDVPTTGRWHPGERGNIATGVFGTPGRTGSAGRTGNHRAPSVRGPRNPKKPKQ